MYEKHFQLERAPFSLLPDPDFLYLGKQHSSAKAFLESSAIVHDSFVVITGEIGAGKTTLVEGHLTEQPAKDTIIARISQTQISPTGFLRLLLDELGLKAFKAKKPELLSQFRKFMATVAGEGRNLVLMIDEAQNLSYEVLEEIRMLTGGPHAASLGVVLIGQPEFLETLQSPKLKQLAQRCRLRSHIEALPERESRAYIAHRIKVAGGDPDKLFTRSAMAAVFQATGGIPRLINSLCDTALICAFADGHSAVDKSEIDAALRELHWQQPTASRKAPGRRKRQRKNRQAAARSARDHNSKEARPGQPQPEHAKTQDSSEELEAALKKIESLQAEMSRSTSLDDAVEQSDARLDQLREQVESLAAHSGANFELQAFESGLEQLTEEHSAIQSKVAELEDLAASLETRQANMVADGDQLTKLHEQLEALESVDQERLAVLEKLREQEEAKAEDERLVATLERALADKSATNDVLEKDVERLRADLTASSDDGQRLNALLKAQDQASGDLAESIRQFTEKLAGRDNTIDTLKAEVREKSKLIDDLHDKLSAADEAAQSTESIRSENEQLTEELRVARAANEDNSRLIADLEKSLATQSDTIADIEQGSDGLGVKLANSKEKNEQLTEQLRVETAANEENAVRIAGLEQALAKESQASAELEQVSDELRSELADSNKEHERLTEHLRAEGAENDENSARIANLEQALAEQSQASADLEEARDRLHAELAESKREKEQLIEEIRIESQANGESSTRIAELEQDCQEQSQNISAFEKETAQLREDLASRQNSQDELQASLKAADDAHAALAGEVSELGKKLTTRDNTISTLEAEVRRKNRLLDELHDKLAPLPALESQLESLAANNDELSADLESRKERIFELQEAVSLGQQRLDDARREMDEAHSSQVNLHMQVSELKNGLSSSKGEARLREELVTSLQAECQNRKKDLRKMRRDLDESSEQSRALKDSLELGEQRVRSLESELQAAMETISEMGESSAQVNSEAEVFGKEIIEQREKLASLAEQLGERSAEVHSLEDSLRRKSETIKVLKLDADATQEARQAEEASLSEHEALVSQLRGEVAARDERIEELQEAAESQAASLADFQLQIGEQSALTQELNEALEVSREAANELRRELDKAGREYTETAVLTDDTQETNDSTAPQTALEAGLIITTNGSPARRVALRDERLIIGRTNDSDIKLDNEFASRHHAQIVFRDGLYFLEDLNSTNGIFVNSQRIKKRKLRNRDVIRIGNDKLIFVLDQHTSH